MAALGAPQLAVAGDGCRAGAAGAGDSYFPGYGNRGYDVRSYDLDIAYDPADDILRGRAKIKARAKQNLCSLNLDLLGFEIKGVKVGAKRARWRRSGQELTVKPKAPLRNDSLFSVTIRYSGVPVDFRDPVLGAPTGFTPTSDGANAVGQPTVATTWFPVNDHPSDKAAYSFDVSVPDGYGVVANGKLRGREKGEEGWTRWLWEADAPMASYLATIDIGRWDVHRWRLHGMPVYDAVDPSITGELRQQVDSSLGKQGEILDFLSKKFGTPYPFDTVGGIVDPERPIGFALENQTRPVYAAIFWRDRMGRAVNGDYVVVHELAHQWFGDDIALHRWRDIWLNEGFATYAEWLWNESQGGPTTEQVYETGLTAIGADDPFWSVAIGDPGANHLFDDPVYYRGGMTLQALRNKIGDKKFWTVVRRWAESRAGGHGTTAQFIALAERISGQPLDDLFERWLFTPEKPQVPAAQTAAISDHSRAADAAMEMLRELRYRLARGSY